MSVYVHAPLTETERAEMEAERSRAVEERAKLRGYIAKLRQQEEAQSRAIRRFDEALTR